MWAAASQASSSRLNPLGQPSGAAAGAESAVPTLLLTLSVLEHGFDVVDTVRRHHLRSSATCQHPGAREVLQRQHVDMSLPPLLDNIILG